MPFLAQEDAPNSNTQNTLPQSPTLAEQLNLDHRCQHRYANQKRCRLNTARQDTRHCVHHLKFYQSSEVSAALTANLAELKSPEALNDFLSRLLLLLAQNKISPRRAAVLGYITNQLLRTIHAIDQKAQQAQRAEATDTRQVNVDIACPTWNPLHDLPEDDPNAPHNVKRRMIIDMPQPEREPFNASDRTGLCSGRLPRRAPLTCSGGATAPASSPHLDDPESRHPERSEGSAFFSAVDTQRHKIKGAGTEARPLHRQTQRQIQRRRGRSGDRRSQERQRQLRTSGFRLGGFGLAWKRAGAGPDPTSVVGRRLWRGGG